MSLEWLFGSKPKVKWEYVEVVIKRGDISRFSNLLGKEGWELVSVNLLTKYRLSKEEFDQTYGNWSLKRSALQQKEYGERGPEMNLEEPKYAHLVFKRQG